MGHVAQEIYVHKQLRVAREEDLPRTIAYLYDYANFAHPFREGNGRATREFFDLLAKARRQRAIALVGEEIQEMLVPAPGCIPGTMNNEQRRWMRRRAMPSVDHFQHR